MKFEILEPSEQFKKERLARLYRDAMDPNQVPGWVTCLKRPEEPGQAHAIETIASEVPAK
ncbi:MAG: hypothetical protein LBN12_02145 [Clostridiales Family XIII bacterium]|jgi:hypothetical protein|nr:hypothetical protein [Clostridiales Family XIII bacterium]